jgi:hypothetical protein
MAKCKVCKTKFDARYFLQKTCLNPACLAEWAKLERELKADKVHAQKKRELKANDRPFRAKESQKAFNAYIRKRDEKEPCISCQRHHSGQYHAGHFKTTAARSDLRFNEDNCHKQCAPCNNHLSGNIGEYIVHLINKIGQVRFDALNKNETVKYSCEQLKEVELKYKNKLKELA